MPTDPQQLFCYPASIRSVLTDIQSHSNACQHTLSIREYMLEGLIMVKPQLSGGWSEPRPLTMQDRRIFTEALGGMDGVTYTPHLVSTQVVNGTNYAFLCGMRSVTYPADVGFAVVIAHKSLNGDIQLTDIRKCVSVKPPPVFTAPCTQSARSHSMVKAHVSHDRKSCWAASPIETSRTGKGAIHYP